MNLKQTKWELFNSQISLDKAAAERVFAIAEASIKARGQFHLVLAGGSTPKNVYESLEILKNKKCDPEIIRNNHLKIANDHKNTLVDYIIDEVDIKENKETLKSRFKHFDVQKGYELLNSKNPAAGII